VLVTNLFNSRRALWLAAFVVIGSFVLLAPLPAFGQGCALCYTQAASSGTRMIHALRDGILILVIPPMFLSVGFTVLAYRKRNQFTDEAQVESDFGLRTRRGDFWPDRS
jgi:hypothetical protein